MAEQRKALYIGTLAEVHEALRAPPPSPPCDLRPMDMDLRFPFIGSTMTADDLDRFRLAWYQCLEQNVAAERVRILEID